MEDFREKAYNEIKVFMMGGLRCGKTSALASIFDSMTNGPVKKYFTVADRTTYEIKDDEKQEPLSGKKYEMVDFLVQKNVGKEILVDAGATHNYWKYKLGLQLPGTSKRLDLMFWEAPGVFFEICTHDYETREMVEECNVFVIFVDTPYLMRENTEASENVCRACNRIDEIQSFLTSINDNEGRDAKQVIFVPIKCEKWYRENRLDEVSAKVANEYDTIIRNLVSYRKMEISILPIVTMGGLEYVEMKDAMVLVKNGEGNPKKCCKLGNKMVRMADGTSYTLQPNDIVAQDRNALVEGTRLVRPYCWFKVDSSEYKPYNCDQLALHIVRFMMNKAIALERKARAGDIFLKRLWSKICSAFDTMPLKELNSVMDHIAEDNLIKDHGDGITRIKTCQF